MSNVENRDANHPWFDSEMQSSVLCSARDYWLQIRANRKCPTNSDFILTDVPAIVAHFAVVDVLHDPMRFRFRMLGTFVTDIAGRNSTGKFLDINLFPDNLEEMTWGYRYCATHMELTATEGPVDFASRDWTGAEALYLPLSGDGVRADIVVCCYDLVNRREELIHEAGDVMLNWQI